MNILEDLNNIKTLGDLFKKQYTVFEKDDKGNWLGDYYNIFIILGNLPYTEHENYDYSLSCRLNPHYYEHFPRKDRLVLIQLYKTMSVVSITTLTLEEMYMLSEDHIMKKYLKDAYEIGDSFTFPNLENLDNICYEEMLKFHLGQINRKFGTSFNLSSEILKIVTS